MAYLTLSSQLEFNVSLVSVVSKILSQQSVIKPLFNFLKNRLAYRHFVLQKMMQKMKPQL